MTNEPDETTHPSGPDEPSGLVDATVPLDDTDDPAGRGGPGESGRAGDEFGELPPPPAPPPGSAGWAGPSQTGLVRDPSSRLGGIASGIAHRYGWDPTLVRLLFVVALVASGGAAFVAYLIAWVVVPRARFWPPARVPNPFRNVSNREAAIGLGVAGIIAYLLIDGGPASGILVPLALVGGGIWLLAQEPRATAEAPVASGGGAAMTGDASVTGNPVSAFTAPPAPVGAPVPPRSRRRTWVVRGLITAVILGLFAAILAPIAALGFWVAGGDGVSLSVGNDEFRVSNQVPKDLASLPRSIRSDNGLARVDLRSIPASDFAELTEPASLDIDIGDGEVWLNLPDGLDYALDATAGSGKVDVDGIAGGRVDRRSVVVETAVPDIVIAVELDEGDIHIDEG